MKISLNGAKTGAMNPRTTLKKRGFKMPRDLNTYEAFAAYMEYREKVAWVKLGIGIVGLIFCGIMKVCTVW